MGICPVRAIATSNLIISSVPIDLRRRTEEDRTLDEHDEFINLNQ